MTQRAFMTMKMWKRGTAAAWTRWGLLCAAALLATPCFGQLELRISVKFILGPGGERPSNSGGFGTNSVALTNEAAVLRNIDHQNVMLDRTGRGYRFRLTEIQSVSGWSGFFSLNARDAANKVALEAVATSNATTRAQFHWRDNAINVYINNTSSGYCSFPGQGDVIFVGSAAYDTLIMHESGHFLNLAHTHDTEQFRNSNGSTCNLGCSCAQLIGGDDGLTDTLLDHECWSRNQMAAGNPGASESEIDRAFRNLMSYHLPQDNLTTQQLDRATDAANTSRSAVATGQTRFVDHTGFSFLQTGSSALPYISVTNGYNNAVAGDIVLVRPGQYAEPGTYTKPVTFRATRGNATIGVP
jgi:hypothetical protein